MLRTFSLLICLFLSFSAHAESGQHWSIDPFEVKYQVKVGIAKAESVVTLNALGDSRFEIVSKTRVKGFFGVFKRGTIDERAVFRYVNGEILAESLSRDDQLSPDERSCEVEYRPEQNEATVRFQGTETIVEIPRDTFNPLLMQIALMQDMAAGNTPEFYNILDHAGLKQFSVAVGQRDQISTPAGRYDAIPVDLVSTEINAGTRMWAVPEENWLAVIVEARKDDEVKATLRVSDLTTG
ncbi:MAG: DUF3108 domain-containing protein [Woeseiaceae bacterium]